MFMGCAMVALVDGDCVFDFDCLERFEKVVKDREDSDRVIVITSQSQTCSHYFVIGNSKFC